MIYEIKSEIEQLDLQPVVKLSENENSLTIKTNFMFKIKVVKIAEEYYGVYHNWFYGYMGTILFKEAWKTFQFLKKEIPQVCEKSGIHVSKLYFNI